MSLLLQVRSDKVDSIARKVFERHFELDPKLGIEYDERRKMVMYDDILINIGYLDTAISMDDGKIFTEYSIWIYRLLCSLMKDLGKERIKDQMIMHYKILYDVIAEELKEDEAAKAKQYIENAILETEKASLSDNVEELFTDEYLDIKKDYLSSMLKNDSRAAIEIIEKAAKDGVKIEDIYIYILQEVMYEVGNLWHKNIITVDKEHFCTSTTQTALSRFYPMIFKKPRNGLKIITCCVGSELHEMGICMVSDLFEYNGWDSLYLGAGVPKSAIINAIEENQPQMVGLSVTMPQHLPLCLDYVKTIRDMFKDVKIAVGGRAFQQTDKLWEKWGVDVYAENAQMFVEWVQQRFDVKG
jgi:MerR family transcriptional regulator, light-induced transcriptional regulator